MYDVSDNPKSEIAKSLLQSKFKVGEEAQKALLERVKGLHIKDKLVDPKSMKFFTPKSSEPTRVMYGGDANAWAVVHNHAFNQLCSMSGFRASQAATYRGFGDKWACELIDTNLNSIFHNRLFLDKKKQPAKFLHRLVSTASGLELRGFLSRSFNRHLASMPLLIGFLDACGEVGAKPIEASTSDVFFSLKCFLPHVFEPYPGEFIVFGTTWSNSDFGRGKMSISLSAMRVVNYGSPIVFNDAISRRHIGSIITDSDIEISDMTALKEVQAQVSAIRDCVVHELSEESLNKMCRALGQAAAEQISWATIKSKLSDLLGKAELTTLKEYFDQSGSGVIDLPPVVFHHGEALPTKWWAANAISHLAAGVVDPDRKADLQSVAGSMLL